MAHVPKMQMKNTSIASRRKTILAVAVASALVNRVASAADTVINKDSTSVFWESGNITVNPNVSVGEDGAYLRLPAYLKLGKLIWLMGGSDQVFSRISVYLRT